MQKCELPISVVERSKARVNDRSLAGVAGPNPAGGMVVCIFGSEVFATGRSLVQRSPTDCSVLLCVI